MADVVCDRDSLCSVGFKHFCMLESEGRVRLRCHDTGSDMVATMLDQFWSGKGLGGVQVVS